MVKPGLAPWLLTLVVGGSGLWATDASADEFPQVTANIDVSQANKSPVRDDMIPNVIVDPSDPQRVYVMEGDARVGSCLLHVSTNGGATFVTAKRSPLPALRGFDRCTPDAGSMYWPMAFAADGSLLVAMHALSTTATPFDGPSSIVVSRTTNAGETWESTIVRDNRDRTPPEGAWQVHMASDRARDRVVVGWQARKVSVPGLAKPANRPYVAVSNDGGRTFGQPIDITAATGTDRYFNNGRGPSLTVAPDGTIYALYDQVKPAAAPPEIKDVKPNLVVARSSDGGKTWDHFVVEQKTAFTGFPEIVAVPYPSSSKYTLVAVFEDLADGSAGDQQVRDIFVSRSTDGGKTWTRRKRVTDDDLTRDFANKYVPGISVAPNGRVDVAWYDTRNDNGNLLTDVYYAYSTDGGATWSRNIRVSDYSSNRHYGQFANYSDVRGPVGISSSKEAAYVVWDDTRNATDRTPVTDAYFAAVQFAPVPPSAALSALRIVGAIVGGLVVTAVVLLVGALAVRRRPTRALAGTGSR